MHIMLKTFIDITNGLAVRASLEFSNSLSLVLYLIARNKICRISGLFFKEAENGKYSRAYVTLSIGPGWSKTGRITGCLSVSDSYDFSHH